VELYDCHAYYCADYSTGDATNLDAEPDADAEGNAEPDADAEGNAEPVTYP
jgi:hypothetical protein